MATLEELLASCRELARAGSEAATGCEALADRAQALADRAEGHGWPGMVTALLEVVAAVRRGQQALQSAGGAAQDAEFALAPIPDDPSLSLVMARLDEGAQLVASVTAGLEVAVEALGEGREGSQAVGTTDLLTAFDDLGHLVRETQNATAILGGQITGEQEITYAQPVGPPGGRPSGPLTRINPRETDETRRSLHRENESAAILADLGYRLEQNSSSDAIARARARTGDFGNVEKNPDFLIEGHVFDCYAPGETKAVRGIWSEVRDKVADRQTERVVVDLRDWRGDLPALQRQFSAWPVDRLKEMMFIVDGPEILHWFGPVKGWLDVD